MTRVTLLLPPCAVAALAVVAEAHHSPAVRFDPGQVIEIEGILTAVDWKNPHSIYVITVSDERGSEVWEVEGGAVTELRLLGIRPGFVSVGDRVRIAGSPSRDGSDAMFGTNMLLENGEEVLIELLAKPHWDGSEQTSERTAQVEASADRTADNIFRVWSTQANDSAAFPMFKGGYPLTDTALSAQAEWNPEASGYLACEPKKMPYIMISPFPMEFVQQDDALILRLEEYDVERTIYMGTDAEPPGSYLPYGFSVGHWEGDDLVVETTNIEATIFDAIAGIPQSRSMQTRERFSLEPDRARLNYELEVNDPEMFREPFKLSRYWVWVPNVQVEPFNCSD